MKKQLLLIVMLLPMVASADRIEINGIYYNLISEGKVAEVSSNPDRYSGRIEIPETVEYENVVYSVTSIGDFAFNRCKDLSSVTIPNSVTGIGTYAFGSCSGLTSISIPNSVSTIGNSAFYDCHYLNSISIGNRVTSIGESVFSSCSRLTSVIIPNSVKSIGNYAFSKCSKLADVYCYAENPPTTDRNTFYRVPIAQATLHVLETSVNLYKEADIWKDFGTIVGDAVVAGVAHPSATPVLVQSNGGALTVQGADDGTQVSIYTTAGTQAGSVISSNGRATVFTNLKPGTIAIVKIGTKSVKVVIK